MSTGTYTNIAKKRVEQTKEASIPSPDTTAASPFTPTEALKNQENKNSRNQEYQKTRMLDNNNSIIQDNKNTSNPEILNSSIQELKTSRIPVIRVVPKREFYQKATYRLSDESLDALEDAKKILKRNYGLKVNLEEIVETAILHAFENLNDKKEKSLLVSKYSGNQEKQNS
jgi:CCR4-NOT transcriptional regulation complex NOT5 subunit